MDAAQTEDQRRRESPTLPEVVEAEADMPLEDAVCAHIIDSSLSDSDGSRDGTPSLSEAIKKELSAGEMDPNTVITKGMQDEEQRLHEEGIRKEEERQKENQKLLEQVDDTTEMRYERLKYLLGKSTMYIEYLVNRMNTQKEEQEKKKERMWKRKAKLEERRQIDETKLEGSQMSCQLRQSGKRKLEDDIIKPNKRTKKRKSNSSQEISADNPGKDGKHNLEESEAVSPDNKLLEPLEKTLTVDENANETRYINGEEVSPIQPQLMEGGVLRPYQVEGYSWLKVLYENGVNGILADEMGLGKTVQCVAMLAHLVQMGVPGPFLVCAPLSTIPNWLSEIQRFAPKIPTVFYHGVKDERATLCRKIRLKHKIGNGMFVKPVVITSYEIAMIDRRYLGSFDWKYLIVDEGHRIKNTHCRLIRELRMYHSTHRLLLTGTPLQNNLAELWSLLNFLLPEIFDDKGSFEMWFDANCMTDASSEEQIVKQEQGKNILGMLHQILSPFMLRRLKSDVDLCIPPKKEVLVYAPLTKEQKDFYSALVDRSIFNLLEEKKEKPKEKVELNAAGHPKRRSASKVINYKSMIETDLDRKSYEKKATGRSRWKNLEEDEIELESWIVAMNDNKKTKSKPVADGKPKTSQVTIKMRNVMMQLRNCCNHPYLLEHPLDPKTGELALTEGVVKVSGKMRVLDQMLWELKKRGHKVLIFSQMTRMLDLIEDFCQIREYKFCRLDGSTPVDDRRDSMGIFNREDSDKFVFLLSTRAGGLGINLTGADTVIIYDSDWNPQCDLQAQDRCHRIGQTKPVVVYRFVTANTIDQKIIERASAKRKLEKMIIHKGNFKSSNFINRIKPITPEELRVLLQSKDHTSELKNEKYTISKDELNALLDRSDLYEQWEQGKNKSQAHSPTPTVTKKSMTLKVGDEAKEKNTDLFEVIESEEGKSTGSAAESLKDGEEHS